MSLIIIDWGRSNCTKLYLSKRQIGEQNCMPKSVVECCSNLVLTSFNHQTQQLHSTDITMPMLEIATNIPKEKVTPDVLTSLSKLVSEALGKAEQVSGMKTDITAPWLQINNLLLNDRIPIIFSCQHSSNF